MRPNADTYKVDAYAIQRRPSDSGPYRMLVVDTPWGRSMQISESPSGRKLRVFVDGIEYVPEVKP